MSKLTLEQINNLANQSDDNETDRKKKNNHNKDQQIYEEQFQHDQDQYHQQNNPNQQQNQYQQDIKQQDNALDVSQVKSEIQEENFDKVSEQHQEDKSGVQNFKKDQDLSLAKSEFIQSAKLNDNKRKQQSKDKLSQPKSKEIDKIQKKKNTQNTKKPVNNQKVSEKPIKEQKVKKVVPKPKKVVQQQKVQQKKQKLSESQINRKMKIIQQQKQQLLKKKQQKQKKEQQIRRKQYEQAKKIEQQRKQKNRKILQQQKLKKKGGANGSKAQKKIPEQQIKIPQKRTDFTYQNMANERKQLQKKINKQIQQSNKNKLKKILQKPQGQLKGEARKAAFLQERKILKQRQNKMRQLQSKQDDVLVVKQIKKQINQCKKFNVQKNQQINRTDKTITALTKDLKQKQKKYYQTYSKGQQQEVQQVNDFSQLTPIQKFIYSFPQAKNSDQIFKIIDANGDGVLSFDQINHKLQQFNLQSEIINKIQEILDQNSDGTVSNQEFVFLIDMELKKQKDYKQIIGTLQINDPLDIEAKIIDMQAKIKYINAQMQKYKNKQTNHAYQQKMQKMQQKMKVIEQRWKKQTQTFTPADKKGISVNTTANLTNQITKLKNQKTTKLAFIQKLRTKVKQNLKQKNKLLTSRVEEGLRLTQQIFNIKNQIQQRQLRYLSMKKIHENKKGYLQRQSQKQKEMEQAYKKTKQYQISISDPGKQAQIAVQRDQLKFLAAVLMIQRNYKRKKARGEFLKLKQQKQKG